MNLKSVTNEKEIKLKGIEITAKREGSTFHEIEFKDTDGGYLVIKLENYCSKAYIKAPPKEKEIYKLIGEVKGIKINEDFDDEYTGKRRKAELESAFNLEDEILKLEKTKVLVEE